MCDDLSARMAIAIEVHAELFSGVYRSLCTAPAIKEGVLEVARKVNSGELTIGHDFFRAHDAIADAGISYASMVRDVVHPIALKVRGTENSGAFIASTEEPINLLKLA